MKSIDEDTLRFLSKNPDEYYVDSKLSKYQFVDNKLIITDGYFNSKKQTISWREKIIREGTNYSVFEDLELSWKAIEESYNFDGFNLNIRDDACKMTPFSAFRYYIDSGIYPPPEVLLALDECLGLYMDLNGKVELEEVFFGQKKRGLGNFSARKQKDDIYETMLFDILLNKVVDPKKSREEIAEKLIISYNLNNDVDSFLRGFRRYLKRKNLKLIHNDEDTKRI